MKSRHFDGSEEGGRRKPDSFFNPEGSALTPSEGWLSFLLLMGAMLAVAVAVQTSDWVDPMPQLWLVALLAMFVGLGAAKVRGPLPVLLLAHAAALGLGFGIAVWETAGTISSGSIADRVDEFFTRSGSWLSVWSSEGISNDKLPFTFGLVAGTWLMAYSSSLLLFRFRWGWPAVIIPALALLTNQTYLPSGRYPLPLFFFMAFAILLLGRTYYLGRIAQWRQRRLTQVSGRYTFVANVAALTLVVFIVGWSIPTERVVIPKLKETYQTARSPWRDLEDEFERVFAGIASQNPSPLHSFGGALPLRGRISLGTSEVFTVVTDFPAYWRGQSYDFYQGRGWIALDEQRDEVRGREIFGSSDGSEFLKREVVAQQVTLQTPSRVLFAAGQPIDVNISSEVEIATPRVYEIDLRDGEASDELPPDIAAAAERIVEARGSLEETASLLPPETEIVRERRGSLEVARQPPTTPDVLSIRPRRELKAGRTYEVLSSVSIATDEELKAAGDGYPKWLTDSYLQLPDAMPDRVLELGVEITADAETPYDKAIAITEFLRDYEETFNIAAPPLNSDAVDFFLFQQRAGYGDYFASAMTVLLRTSGVPARLASGYASGEWDPATSSFTVRLSDAHSWPEVYFPGYGWIPFEPSPNLEPIPRGPLGFLDLDIFDDSAFDPNEDLFFDDSELFDVPGFEEAFLPDEPTEVTSIIWGILIKIGLAIAALLGALATLFFIIYTFWELNFLRLGYAQGLYARMGKLGAWAWEGPERRETPGEYASNLASTLSLEGGHSTTIADGFALVRYGGERSITEGQREELGAAWRSLRGDLIRRLLRRLNLRRLVRGS